MPKPHVKGIEEPDLRTTLDPKRTALAERCRSWDLADILFPDLDVAFCPITDSASLRLYGAAQEYSGTRAQTTASTLAKT